mgnify:FL=1
MVQNENINKRKPIPADLQITEAVMGSTTDVQKRVFFNKVNHGFNTTDVPKEFCLLYGEVAEAFDAWKQNRGLDLELADVAIYLLGLAEINGIDLGKAINKKMDINEPRTYEVGSDEWYESLSPEMKDYFADGMK